MSKTATQDPASKASTTLLMSASNGAPQTTLKQKTNSLTTQAIAPAANGFSWKNSCQATKTYPSAPITKTNAARTDQLSSITSFDLVDAAATLDLSTPQDNDKAQTFAAIKDSDSSYGSTAATTTTDTTTTTSSPTSTSASNSTSAAVSTSNSSYTSFLESSLSSGLDSSLSKDLATNNSPSGTSGASSSSLFENSDASASISVAASAAHPLKIKNLQQQMQYSILISKLAQLLRHTLVQHSQVYTAWRQQLPDILQYAQRLTAGLKFMRDNIPATAKYQLPCSVQWENDLPTLEFTKQVSPALVEVDGTLSKSLPLPHDFYDFRFKLTPALCHPDKDSIVDDFLRFAHGVDLSAVNFCIHAEVAEPFSVDNLFLWGPDFVNAPCDPSEAAIPPFGHWLSHNNDKQKQVQVGAGAEAAPSTCFEQQLDDTLSLDYEPPLSHEQLKLSLQQLDLDALEDEFRYFFRASNAANDANEANTANDANVANAANDYPGSQPQTAPIMFTQAPTELSQADKTKITPAQSSQSTQTALSAQALSSQSLSETFQGEDLMYRENDGAALEDTHEDGCEDDYEDGYENADDVAYAITEDVDAVRNDAFDKTHMVFDELSLCIYQLLKNQNPVATAEFAQKLIASKQPIGYFLQGFICVQHDELADAVSWLQQGVALGGAECAHALWIMCDLQCLDLKTLLQASPTPAPAPVITTTTTYSSAPVTASSQANTTYPDLNRSMGRTRHSAFQTGSHLRNEVFEGLKYGQLRNECLENAKFDDAEEEEEIESIGLGYLQVAADLGLDVSQYLLSLALEDEAKDGKPVMARSVFYLYLAARQGNLAAIRYAARSTVDNWRGEKDKYDPDFALFLYHLFLTYSPRSYSVLDAIGLLFHNGLGVAQDFKIARYLFIKSAFCASDGCYMLGLMYFKGEGVKQNYDRARFYFEQVRGQHPYQTYALLGFLYESGYGGEPELEKALELYMAGTAEWDPYCIERYAYFLLHGLCIKQNVAKALELYDAGFRHFHDEHWLELAKQAREKYPQSC